MSPAAPEFNSPPKTQSKQQPPFTPQNPKPNFTSSAFSVNSLSEHHQSSFSNCFAFGDSAVSSRSKPRLVKRRQLGFQRGKCLNFTQVNNNGTSSDRSNGLSASMDGVMHKKLNNEGFVFGASKSDLESDFNAEKKQTCSDGDGRFNNFGFVFSADKSSCGSHSNLEQKEHNLMGDYRGSSDKSSLLSSLDVEKTQSGGMGQNSDGFEVETRKAEAHDVFVFESSSAKSFSFSKSTEVGDEMSKVNPQNVRNDTGLADTYLGKLDFLINSKSNFVFGSSANTVGTARTSTVSKLSDEIKKMTVCNCEKIGCSCHMKNPSTDASASSKPVFVFGSNKKSPSYCTGKSQTTSCHELMNEGLRRHGNGSAVDSTEGFNFRTIEKDTFVFASSRDAACSFGEGAQQAMPNEKNQQARSWLGDMDEQIKLGCPVFRCDWEERQPKNTNNNSYNDPSLGIPSPNPFVFQAERDIGYDAPQDQLNDHSKLNITTNEALFPHCRLDSEALFSGRVENEGNFRFASTPLEVRKSATDFRTSKGDTSCAFTVNLSPRLNEKFESSGKSRSERDKGWKNRRRKLRSLRWAFPESKQNHLPKEDSQQHMESPRSYSPMDFTPYQDNNSALSTSNGTTSPQGKNEDLETVSEGATGKGAKKCRESNEEYLHSHEERVVQSSLEESQIDCSNSNTKREESECNKQNQFSFAAREEDDVERNFTFSASCTQDKLSTTKRHNRKKYRMKVGHAPNMNAPNTTNPSQKVDTASSSVQFPVQPHDKEENSNSKYKGNQEDDKQGSTARTQKACQKWQIRGNQAYEKGNLSKAEEFYTKGINSVPHSGTSGCCIAPLVLCYSNRAAARMSLGRMREALGDCMRAAALDPNFQRVQIRAANCHLAMGEVEVAQQYFNKCLETGAEVCLDRRIIIEAANGLQKAQKVAKSVNQCDELIQQRTCNAAISALEVISGVLSISSYSEKLLEMKGEALLMLGRYEEVIRLCEQTLVFAEHNVVSVAGDNNLDTVDGPTYNNSSIRLWRWRLMAKSYFHLGRLDVALDLLEKQELLRSSEDRCGGNSIPFAVTVRELLHHKNAGNEAFQSGRHTQAVEHYTAAVSSNIESRPFAAICFCNRAAAYQALGQISDAIADCSLAIALDGSYSKAVSRRATLHEKIRDYEQAASDLQLLISLSEKQSQEELTQIRRRHCSMEEKAKKGMSLDHYVILGIKQSDTASEIKKAYRKAALRHHPDKAGQFLARSESGDDGKLWKEIADEVHKDADRLFKMIGEAYAVLSDPTKRSEYDLQEELRTEQKGKNGSRGFRGSSEFYKSPSRTTANGRYRQEYRYSYYDEW